MTLDDVPADVELTLTTELDRLFKAAKCNPMCHVCFNRISIGNTFSLVSLDGTDQMACARKTCGRTGLEKKAARLATEKQDRIDTEKTKRAAWEKKYPNAHNRPAYGGGYSRPSKVCSNCQGRSCSACDGGPYVP